MIFTKVLPLLFALTCVQFLIAQPKMFETTFQYGLSTDKFKHMNRIEMNAFNVDDPLNEHRGLIPGRFITYGLNYFRLVNSKFKLYGKLGCQTTLGNYVLILYDMEGAAIDIMSNFHRHSQANFGLFKWIELYDKKVRLKIGGSLTLHWYVHTRWRSFSSNPNNIPSINSPQRIVKGSITTYNTRYFKNSANISESTFHSPVRFEPAVAMDFKIWKGLYLGFEVNLRRRKYVLYDFSYTVTSTESEDYEYTYSQGRTDPSIPKPLKMNNFVYVGFNLSYSYEEIPFIQKLTDKVTKALF